MPRHFVTLCISTLVFLAACSRGEAPSQLQIALGPYTQQLELGSSNAEIGTALVVKLQRDLDEASTLTLYGPENWNGGVPYRVTYPVGADWIIASEVDIAPVAGEYRLEAQIGEKTLERIFVLGDVNARLELTKISVALINEEMQRSVEVSWTPVPNTRGYFVRLFDGETGQPVLPDVYTLSTSTRFDVSTLNATDFVVGVYSTTFNTVTEDPDLPEQFALSDSIAVVTTPPEDIEALSTEATQVRPQRLSVTVKH